MAMGVHPLNKDKFYEAMNLYVSGQLSQEKAAKIAGCSKPTFLKYANKIYGGEELPDNLWGKKDSCMFYVHSDIANDEFVKSKLQEVVDYIRDNYDLDIFTRI